ncbi:MAG: hypothetical protein IPN80_01155 [Flavobacterium sp.]|nr:hypothetical protein [Flavobacterium sp.]
MKKLFLGLIATVMICFAGNAQTKISTDLKSVIDAQMITLVHAAKQTYIKGMTASEWIKQNGPYSPTKDETLLLEKVFSYLSLGTLDSDILKQDNSVLLTVSKSIISDSGTSSQNRWCFKCILQALQEILEVIIRHLP